MKLSERLYDGAIELWRVAADKPFVREMALGTLDEKRFRHYMIQDYFYLLDYIEILNPSGSRRRMQNSWISYRMSSMKRSMRHTVFIFRI